MILNIFLLMLSIVILWMGANKLVDSAGRIAGTLGVSELVIGLTIVAFGTSAPEFAVSLSAALKGIAGISVGNIVGSNIFNIGFILGSVAVVRTIRTTRRLVYRDGLLMVITTIILLFFFRDLTLEFCEGLILFLGLIAYLLFLFIKKEQPDDDVHMEKARWFDWIILPVSIAGIVLGGELLVRSGCFIARFFGLSEWLIGVTIIAAGTSAPEMATSLAAAVKGKHGISAGNLIGSNLFNLLGVLGLAGMIRPLTILNTSFYSLIMLSVMVILVVIILRTRWRVSRVEGIILILLGMALWVYDFLK